MDKRCLNVTLALDVPSCPAAGYRSIFSYIETLKSPATDSYGDFDIRDSSLRKTVIARGRSASRGGDSWAAIAHSPSAQMHAAAQALWTRAISWLLIDYGGMPQVPPRGWLATYPSHQTFKTDTEVPIVWTRCSTGPTETNSTVDKVVIHLPIKPIGGNVSWTTKMKLGSLARHGIRKRIEKAGKPRPGQVVTVPMAFSEGQYAVVILQPILASNGTITRKWNALGCSFAAYWASGTVSIQLNSIGDLSYDFASD
ncbi:hypothetical protein QQS21_005430 [Conoideocrella luteorostrata]|uniref:Uncharacterized protein n=1 Tax=Conoideocrella luteorostrata TaxID=1105319 RepID=A0AAJ0FUG5_9HYPO|nr:hypothetical protein QQS21_005430 [Conoideocrella luteorostrata]